MVTATRSALHTPLCDRLGVRVPTCQGGIAFVVRDLTDRPFRVDILFAPVRATGQETERFTDAVKGAIRRWSDP
jgi:hypothetical protein